MADSATPATVERIAAEVGGSVCGPGEGAAVALSSVTHDSRTVQPGSLFVCIKGASADGHLFAPAAIEAGAVALLVERELELEILQILVADSRRAMGPAAAAVYDHPDEDVTVIGVTGTNGKTTVTQMLGSMLAKLGCAAEVQGTLSGARTTPEAPELFAKLADMRGRAVKYLAMEVSSHALELHRVDGIKFGVSAFTNLSQDHLDFHSSMETYFDAKALLFDPKRSAVSIFNADDQAGQRLLALHPGAKSYSLAEAEDLTLDGPTSSFWWRGFPVTIQLAGVHNVSNALCAAAILVALDFSADQVADAIGAIDPVPGRMEWINIGQPFRVVVDYSHTPDSLAVALAASRASVQDGGAVRVVFGCGGDRDPGKRPIMGAVAAEAADHVMITSDNPRSENPISIIDQIASGTSGDNPNVETEPDRALAIDTVIGAARPGDVVLIAGKGHETTQTIGNEVRDFDDRVAAIEALQRAGW